MSLVYRPEQHEYWANGSQVPGVTRMLSDLGYFGQGKKFFTERSRNVGSATHKACMLADQHCPKARTLGEVLDRLDMPEAIHPYLAGYIMFRNEKEYRAAWWERPAWNPQLRVAGTPDTGVLAAQLKVGVDVKTWKVQGTKPKRSAAIQVVLYDMMMPEPAEKLWLVRLPGDGKYRIYEVKRDVYIDHVARSIVTTWHDMHDHGLLKLAGDPEEYTAGEDIA